MRGANGVLGLVMARRIPVHLIVAASAWVSRIITAVVQLISVRILIESLGTEQYAVFALLIGLMSWYLLSDLGIGYSLQNYISERRAKEQAYDDYLTMAAVILMLLLMFTIVILYFISPYTAPVFLKHFTFLSEGEKTRYFFVSGALFIGTSIGSVVYKVWYAQQRGYLANIVPAIASLIALAGLYWLSGTGVAQKLFWILVIFLAPKALLALLPFIWNITKSIKSGFAQLNKELFLSLIRRAGNFWFFSLMAAGVLQIDYIMLSQFTKAQEIVIYDITIKIFSLIFFVYSAVLMALWPVCTEMLTLNKWQEVKKYLKQCIFLGIAFMIFSTFLIALFIPQIVKIISPGVKIVIPLSFIVLFGFYQVLRVWTDTFSMVLQSMSQMRPFWHWVPVQAVLSCFLQLLLVPRYGIYGVVLGLIGSFILTVVWALPQNVFRFMRLSRGEVS